MSKNRNEVLRLSDVAIATGNALSFDKLGNIYVSSAEEDIKMAALSEMLRVKNYFATMTGIKGVELSSTINTTGKIFKDNEIPTDVLIEYLKTNNDWKIRAKAAKLLKNRKEKEVPEALLHAIKKDTHLEVRKLSMDSFERVTGFTSTDVFKYEPALNWWDKKAIDVNKTLNKLQTVESVTGENLQ